jgi:hypothetical protein
MLVTLACTLSLLTPHGDIVGSQAAEVRLERITTAVPWPRGLVFVDGELVVLARGRHRRAGGPDPSIEDLGGSLLRVDPSISEPVVKGSPAGPEVAGNAELLAAPTDPPFKLWDRSKVPASLDTRMDRPYCTLAWDPTSRNFIICGFSGADMPDGTFRKNASDSVLRFDTRTGRWSIIDVHDERLVDDTELGPWVPDDTYPQNDPRRDPPPHGWTNGPDGAAVVGRWLYVAAKDNSLLVRYDLGPIADDPEAGPPPAEPVFGDHVDLATPDGVQRTWVCGHSAVAASGGFLYVGFRTTSQVVRFPLEEDGTLRQPLVGELIALFDPYDEEIGRSHDLMDIAFNGEGELFVSTARAGSVWRVGVPDPAAVFDGREGTAHEPYVDLRELTENAKARTGNITFDEQGRLYVCSGNYDAESPVAGVVYRVVEGDRPR